MKNYISVMNKWGGFLILLIIPILFSGCTHDMSRNEIDEIDLVLVLGIDYAEGQFTLSGLYSTGSGSDPEEGSGSGSEEVAQGIGKTAYEALEDMKLKNKKAISLAQAGSFLIGEGAAKLGIDQSLDFLSRDETIKMEALIYVIKGESAADFIKEGIENEQTIHEDLEAMKQKQQEILTRNDNTMVNILNDMRQSYSCVLIPYLIADKSGYLIEGYTVFNELKFKDYLDHETSDGVNFIRNIMRTYPIYLDNQIGLLTSYTNTSLKADVKKQKITVTVKVSFETMVKEVVTDQNIFNMKDMERLTKAQNEYIKTIIEKPINYSKNNSLDILNLARIVENQNYKDWQTIEKDWAKQVADINYEFKLQSRISKSFLLGNEKRQ